MNIIDSNSPLWLNTLCLCVNQRRVTCNHVNIELTGLEFEILYVLMRNAGKVVSRRAIQQYMQTMGIAYNGNSLTMHISNVRKKLSPAYCDIQTIRGAGYKITQPNKG